jgi:hypothetical protein
MPDVYALVRDLRQRRWSRNRHFQEHATRVGQRARGLHRFVASLERDICRATAVALHHTADGDYRLELVLPQLRVRRTVVVSSELLAFLREDGAIAARLDSRAESAD